jgi:RNA-directed DNA polymerase
MRAVQFRILKEILEKVETPEYIFAFEKGRGIPDMAQHHIQKGIVISLDLKDFFGSIKQYHLDQLFEQMGFGTAASRTLSELCTFQSFVPQGALTSPKISSIIMALTAGPLIKAFCDERGYTLTIYADDITISIPTLPEREQRKHIVTNILSFVTKTVSKFRFRVNKEKTKVMYPFQRQYVCGVVVNRKSNLQKSKRRTLRAVVYNCERNGIEAEAAKTSVSPDTFVSKLMGQLNWFGQLNPEAGARSMSKLREILVLGREPSKVRDGGVKTSVSPDISNTVPETSPAAEVPWC